MSAPANMMSLGLAAALAAILLSAGPVAQRGVAPAAQPAIGARVKAILTVDGLRFKDANGNGRLDAYEDWRLAAAERARDLVSRMTLEDKAGMMLIDTLNPGAGGTVAAPAEAYIRDQKMTRFIFRSVITAKPAAPPAGRGGGFGGSQVTPGQAAEWANRIQELAERTSLGVPVVFKSNARNHYERSARFGINTEAGSMSEWPKEAGLAATRDMDLIAEFARIMGQEWRAVGLRGMYGYMADLATEPRWYRTHECFTSDADLNAAIMRTLVMNLQGGPVSPRTAVALTVKHFPGGGPQQLGLDPHFTFGKNQVYPAGRFADHLKPFVAAIDAGVSAVMPYYGVPVDLAYNGVRYDAVGMAFSRQVVTDLLRTQLGFDGYVNSDTGIVTDRAWGLESRTVPERIAAAINAGVDVLSGFHDTRAVTDVVRAGLVSESRVTEAAVRLLKEQFLLGLFEDPYIDAVRADAVVGSDGFRARAMDAQRASIVLLQNGALGQGRVLPIRAPTSDHAVRVYTMGLNERVVSSAGYGGYNVVNGDYDPSKGERRASAAGSDYAIIRVEVTVPRDVTSAYRSSDPATGANPAYLNPLTGKTWGAEDPTGVDNLMFGSPFPWEAGNISFSAMAASRSWRISPPLADIQAVMNEAGAARTVLCIYFRQPYVLDEGSGLTRAGAILAGFGVSDAALMDVVTGRFAPKGRLPFALAKSLKAVADKPSDSPTYPPADTLFPFGHGLTFPAARSVTAAPRLFMAGDSTMADKPLDLPERGWGMVLPRYFKDPAVVRNHAVNGRSTKSFIDEGRWQAVVEQLREDDVVIVQFGHNDEKREDPARYTDPETTFRDNLRRFVSDVRARKASAILATPVARRKFDASGALTATHGEYPDAVRAVAREEKVPLLDLERDTSKWLQEVGDEPSRKFFMWIEPGRYPKLPDGRQDDTHFVEAGAMHVAELAIAEMRALKLPITEWLR